jgi:hypothetical protein
MFKYTLTIKFSQAMSICGKMSRNPIQNNSYTCFVKLIDKYGLRGADAALPKTEKQVAALARVDTLPEPGADMALYAAGDGSIGLAWADGVTVLTPMEAFGLASVLLNAGN